MYPWLTSRRGGAIALRGGIMTFVVSLIVLGGTNLLTHTGWLPGVLIDCGIFALIGGFLSYDAVRRWEKDPQLRPTVWQRLITSSATSGLLMAGGFYVHIDAIYIVIMIIVTWPCSYYGFAESWAYFRNLRTRRRMEQAHG